MIQGVSAEEGDCWWGLGLGGLIYELRFKIWDVLLLLSSLLGWLIGDSMDMYK